MYLMIRDEESIKVVKNIHLKDGYLPSVDGYSPVGEDGLPEIEPGIWFKAEVFSGVLVDCTERVLKWTTEEQEFCPGRSFITKDHSEVDFSRFTRYLYEGECYDFETGIDDLFNTAASLLEKERARTVRGKRKTSFNSSKMIIRILHCHILPAIRMRPTDLKKVEAVYKKQERVVQGVNKDLERMSQDIENTKLGIQFKRESMVKELQNCNMVEVYPRDILLLLETQIQGDIDREARALDREQEEVNRLKLEPNAGDLLVKKRKVRDHIYEKQVALITARENIVQVLQAMAKKGYKRTGAIKWQPACARGSGTINEEIICTRGNKDLANQYVMYMKVNDLLQEQRNKRFIVTSKLEFILSVRETVRETLQDLRSGKESVGFTRDRTRRGRAADILLHASIPEEWLTLTERVGDLLMEGDNPIRKRHQDFVSQIRDRFLAAINVGKVMLDRGAEEVSRRRSRRRARSLMHKEFKQVATITVENDEDIKSQTASILRTRAMSSRSFKRRMDSIVGMPFEEPNFEDDEIQEQIGSEIKFLVQQIHTHFDFMSSELQVATDAYSDTVYYKTWLCYEGHFYRDTMDRIMELYTLNYRQVCSNLETNASLITTEDLGLEDQWLLSFFRENTAEEQSQNPNTGNVGYVCWSDPPTPVDKPTKSWAQNESPPKRGKVFELKTITRNSVEEAPPETGLVSPEKSAAADAVVDGHVISVDQSDDHVINVDQSDGHVISVDQSDGDVISVDQSDFVVISVDQSETVSSDNHLSPKTEVESASDCRTSARRSDDEVNRNEPCNGQEHEYKNRVYLETDLDAISDEGEITNTETLDAGFVNPVVLVTIENKLDIEAATCSVSTTDVDARDEMHPEKPENAPNDNENLSSANSSDRCQQDDENQDAELDPTMDIPNLAPGGSQGPDAITNGADADAETNHENVDPTEDNVSYSSEESVDFPGDPDRAASEVVQRELKKNQSRRFMETFAPAIACIEAILREYIPLNKLQLMTKCVRTVQKIVMQIQSESSDSQNVMCCDDFLTIIPLILLHADHTSMANLYPHIIMLMDLMAPFLTNGIHSNSLTHFFGAYQILFSMMVVQTKH